MSSSPPSSSSFLVDVVNKTVENIPEENLDFNGIISARMNLYDSRFIICMTQDLSDITNECKKYEEVGKISQRGEMNLEL